MFSKACKFGCKHKFVCEKFIFHSIYHTFPYPWYIGVMSNLFCKIFLQKFIVGPGLPCGKNRPVRMLHINCREIIDEKRI